MTYIMMKITKDRVAFKSCDVPELMQLVESLEKSGLWLVVCRRLGGPLLAIIILSIFQGFALAADLCDGCGLAGRRLVGFAI